MTIATAGNTANEKIDLLEIFEPLDENLAQAFEGLDTHTNSIKSSSRRKINMFYSLDTPLQTGDIIKQIGEFAKDHNLTLGDSSDDHDSPSILSGGEIIGLTTVTNDTGNSGALIISINDLR